MNTNNTQRELPFQNGTAVVDDERDRELDRLQEQRNRGEALAREASLQRGFRIAGHLDDY